VEKVDEGNRLTQVHLAIKTDLVKTVVVSVCLFLSVYAHNTTAQVVCLAFHTAVAADAPWLTIPYSLCDAA